MNRSDTILQTPAQVGAAHASIPWAEAKRRLAVVILDVEDETLLASRILELARPLDLRVLLIGIAPDPVDEQRIRRNLVTIAAFLREDDALHQARGRHDHHGFTPEMQIVQGGDWPTRIHSYLQPDDMLACYSEQVGGSRKRPLADILASSTRAPIYSFTSLHPAEESRPDLLSQAAAWLTSLASIGGCFLVQARIVTTVQGWAQTALLLVSLFAEAGLIWLLNSLFSQS
jgi:hypothetical protein